MSKKWLNRKKGRQILLRDKMRKHLESNWNGVVKETREKELDRLRCYLIEGLDDLVLAANTLPVEEQNEIFAEDRIRPLVIALLTGSEKKKVHSMDEESRNAMVDREFQIAAMFMEKGITKCLDRVRKPYVERMMRDAAGVALILNYEATRGKRQCANIFDLSEKKAGEWREKVPPLLPLRAQK